MQEEQKALIARLFCEMEEKDKQEKLGRFAAFCEAFAKVESSLIPTPESVRTSVQELYFYLEDPTELSKEELDRINNILEANPALEEKLNELQYWWEFIL